MKERFLIVLLAVAVFAVVYLANAKNAGEDRQDRAELLTPQDYCEYIESLELYIQFLEGEIDRLDDAYIGDVIIETDEYWDYQEAENKFYGIAMSLNKED